MHAPLTSATLQRTINAVNTARPAWLRRLPVHGPVALRLFCFPSAGAGASSFGSWPRDLPPGVELCAVQLPGREDRRADPSFLRLTDAVQHVCATPEPFRGAPFAFFGHSMGALLAFETARALRSAGGPAPEHLFCSACPAPDAVPAQQRIFALPHAAFLEQVRRFGGMPEPILRDPEMLQLFLPTLRADLELYQTYAYREEEPLRCPITAYGGVQDTEVPPSALPPWRRHTSGPFEQQLFPSGHFFIHSDRAAVLGVLSAALRRLTRSPDD